MKAALCLTMMLLLTSCAAGLPPQYQATVGEVDAADILEAALTIAIEDCHKNALPFEVCCIEVGSSHDPSAELLSRLSVVSPNLEPRSMCYKVNVLGIPNEYKYLERKTHRRAIVVFASIEKSLPGGIVQVTYGWDQYQLAARINSVEMEKRDGK